MNRYLAARVRMVNRARLGGVQEGLLFVNKKKQNNFLNWVMGGDRACAHDPAFQKLFGSFFQKRTSYANALLCIVAPRKAGMMRWGQRNGR
jgi:hypothetical protein